MGVFLLLGGGLFELYSYETFRKYSKTESDSVGLGSGLGSLPDLYKVTHLLWDKFSSQNYTETFDLTNLW